MKIRLQIDVSAPVGLFCWWIGGLGHRWEFTINGNKGQWRGAFVFSLICAWINGWINNREAGDLIRHRAHYYVTAMQNQLIEAYLHNQGHGWFKIKMSSN